MTEREQLELEIIDLDLACAEAIVEADSMALFRHYGQVLLARVHSMPSTPDSAADPFRPDEHEVADLRRAKEALTKLLQEARNIIAMNTEVA